MPFRAGDGKQILGKPLMTRSDQPARPSPARATTEELVEFFLATWAARRSGRVTEPSVQHNAPIVNQNYSDVLERYHLDRNYGMED